jgi:signal transduction histidine kinase
VVADFRQKLGISKTGPWAYARYGIAVGVPIVVTLFQALFGHYTQRTPQVMFLAGVFVAAWLAGPGPGVVASLLSGISSEFLFIRSPHLLDGAVSIGLFVLICTPVLILTARLQKAERTARALSEVREEFLAAASHELRGPLTALSLQLAKIDRDARRSEDPRAARIAQTVEKSNRILGRLTRLIDLLLDITRLQAGKLTLDIGDVDLVEVVREVVARVADDPSMRCSVAVDADRPIFGKWDRARLDQVVTNLISNACKYGGGKPVRVALERQNGTAKIVVRDEGPGIPANEQSRLFGRFERIGADKNIAGTGLGLWITRQIVDAHGGSVRVESDVGKGATFIVELPGSEHVQSVAQ